MLKQVLLIFGCLLFGKFLVHFTGLKLPASIVGMFALLALMMSGLVKPKDVSGIGNFFNSNLAFFFVPATVAVMAYADLLFQNFWVILLASLVSFVLVMLVTGWTHQALRKRKK